MLGVSHVAWSILSLDHENSSKSSSNNTTNPNNNIPMHKGNLTDKKNTN